MTNLDREHSKLPPPWNRIFSLGTRTFVWGLLLAILYILRPFFLMVFLTFLFAYIQAHCVQGLSDRIRNRPTRVVVVFITLVGILGALGYSVVPRVKEQAEIFADGLPETLDQADAEIYKFGQRYPTLWRFLSGGGTTDPDPLLPDEGVPHPSTDPSVQEEGEDRPPIVRDLLIQLLGFGTEEGQEPDLTVAIENIGSLGAKLLGIGSAFLLSLLFSFLIVMDLPKLSRSVSGLSKTKIGFIYDEVAENIRDFGKVLGRALEAQIVIALVNTSLTAIGMSFLGLPNIVFLSSVVFLCSFIPVAGVFISSFPICLIALQQDNGFTVMLIAITLILVIHTIEAYVLNPQIFGHHLRMNPVLVLIVLVIAGKLFGVWGLILGVPIVNYVFAHAIRRKPVEPEPARA